MKNKLLSISIKCALFYCVSLVFLSACISTFEVGVESNETSQQVPQTDESVETIPLTVTPMPLVEPNDEPPGPILTPTTSLETGVVHGKVCFPSEYIPEMTVYFQDTRTGNIFEEDIAENQNSFEVEIPAGLYIAFAYPKEMELGGTYSELVACGFGPECSDHSLRSFVVGAGDTNEVVEICDWYAPEMVPPRPTAGSQERQENLLIGLIYQHFGTNELWQVGTGGELNKIIELPDATISPDGRQALYEQGDDIWIVDLVAGDRRNLTNTPERIESYPQWWPAREGTVIFGSWEQMEGPRPGVGQLSIISVDGSGYHLLEEMPSNSPPAPSPDGQTIAYEVDDTPWLYHLDSGVKERFDMSTYGLIPVEGMKVDSPSWSPDGKLLSWWVSGTFMETTNNTIAVVVFFLEEQYLNILHPYRPVGGGWGWLVTPSWSPDGNWLAMVTYSERSRADLWIARMDGMEEHHLGWADRPVWSPDGQFLAFRSYDKDESASLVELGVWQPQTLDLPAKSVPVVWSAVVQYRTVTEPSFEPEITFASQPDLSYSQLVFPFGTSQVFAMWSYAHMRDGLTIHREWYRDGELWIVREEPWDFGQYGESGIVRDISIYDFEEGLDPGVYQLRLFIDGEEQTVYLDEQRFVIAEANDIAPLSSTDGSLTAIVDPPGKLIIEDAAGTRNNLLNVDEISSLAWYPNSRLLLYSVRDRTGQDVFNSPYMFGDQLWAVNIDSGEIHQILNQSIQLSFPDLHHPQPSPSGNYIASITGNGYTSECWVNQQLVILQVTLDNDVLRESFNYMQQDFEPLTLPENYYMYAERIVRWTNDTQLMVEFKWNCSNGESDGVYLLDVLARTAERLD